MLSLKWLMHQRTWTFDVKLECSQAIVGLRESQNKETNASANPTQAVESFGSNDKKLLSRLRCVGQLSTGNLFSNR